MKIAEIHNYSINRKKFTAYCDGQLLDCVATATKVTEISNRTFGFLTWIYLYILDFLANHFDYFTQSRFEKVEELTSEAIESQKKFLAQRDKVAEFAKKHFTVVAKNVEHLDQAEVICLGETHTSRQHRKNNAELIDKMCELEDLILVEHNQNDGWAKLRSDQAKYVQHNLDVQGWDLDNSETLRAFEKACQVKIESLEDLYRLLVLKKLPWKNEYQVRKATQMVYDNLPARNRNLCKCLDSHSRAGRRIYTIAGSDHLRPVSMSKDKGNKWLNREPQDIMFRETLESLKTKKFVILTPKSD